MGCFPCFWPNVSMLIAEAKVKRSVANKNAEEASNKVMNIKKQLTANMRIEKNGDVTVIDKAYFELLSIDLAIAYKELAHYKSEYADWSVKESTLRMGDKINDNQKLQGSIKHALERVKKSTEQAITNQDSASDVTIDAHDALIDLANNSQMTELLQPVIEEISINDFMKELIRLKRQEQKEIEEEEREEIEEEEEEIEEEEEEEEKEEVNKSMYKSVKKTVNVVSS